jgi:hypothetical protein
MKLPEHIQEQAGKYRQHKRRAYNALITAGLTRHRAEERFRHAMLAYIDCLEEGFAKASAAKSREGKA